MESVLMVVMLVAILCGHQWHGWRKRAIELQAFINNPHVHAVDPKVKEQQYKDSYEAMVNALEDERRDQLEAMAQAFEVLNDRMEVGDTQMVQARNVLLRAIQNNTYGRGSDESQKQESA